MNEAFAIWSDEEGHAILVKSNDNGRCQLEFRLEDLQVDIAASKESLLNATAGGKVHFASEEGSCEVDSRGQDIRLKVQEWGGAAAVIELDSDRFRNVLKELPSKRPPSRTFL